jgi:hypothetical protein
MAAKEERMKEAEGRKEIWKENGNKKEIQEGTKIEREIGK